MTEARVEAICVSGKKGIVKREIDEVSFAENIITHDIDLTAVNIGEQLHLGKNVILEITQRGKKCHNDCCAIKKATGDCIMPKEGLFARVIRGGVLAKGDAIRKPVPAIS